MATLNTTNYYTKEKEKDDEDILQPFVHIIKIPGKKVRSVVIKALNDWMQIPEDKLKKIEFVLDTLHNASLLIDDIQDNSILRRGIPCAHTIYGATRTILSSNYTFSKVCEVLTNWKNTAAEVTLIRNCLNLTVGQGMELYWRENFICPTLEEYQLMCIRKTGGLFLLSIELMQHFSDNQMDFTKFGATLGLFFQIRDDYMNLTSAEYEKNKTFCEDISEGKFSFPIIHAIQSQPNDKRVINILKKRPDDFTTKKICLELLNNFGSLAYTRKVLNDLKNELLEMLEKLPENPAMKSILNKILHFENA